jgi:hypothetical protein
MAEATQWEYHVIYLGSFWSGPKEADFEATLNELGVEGWELAAAMAVANSNQVRVVLKRPLSSDTRRRRSWPG